MEPAQNAVFKLQNRLAQVNQEENAQMGPLWLELNDPESSIKPLDITRRMSQIHAHFSKKRDRIIWWYQYGTDVVVFSVIFLVALFGVWMFVF